MAINKRLDPKNLFRTVKVDGVKETNFLADPPLNYEFETVQSVFMIERKHVGRPDVISNEVYGDTAFDWVIMLANDIDDPFEDIKVGDTIVLPEVTEIFDFLDRFSR